MPIATEEVVAGCHVFKVTEVIEVIGKRRLDRLALIKFDMGAGSTLEGAYVRHDFDRLYLPEVDDPRTSLEYRFPGTLQPDASWRLVDLFRV